MNDRLESPDPGQYAQTGQVPHRRGTVAVDTTDALPTVEITTGWFAGLRRRPRWSMIVHDADGALVTRQCHPSYREALDAAFTVCRDLGYGSSVHGLAA